MRIADCGMGERREAQPDLSQGCQAQELAPNPHAVGARTQFRNPRSAFRNFFLSCSRLGTRCGRLPRAAFRKADASLVE